MDTTPTRVDARGQRAIWQVSPTTGEHTLVASWMARFFAHLLDVVVIIAVIAAFAGIGYLFDQDAAWALAAVGWAVAIVLYAPLMLAFNGGQTLGKMALGVKVLNDDSAEIGLGRAVAREVGLKLLPGVISPLNLIDYIWAAFRDDRRSLHDLAAGTVVVERRGTSGP